MDKDKGVADIFMKYIFVNLKTEDTTQIWPENENKATV